MPHFLSVLSKTLATKVTLSDGSRGSHKVDAAGAVPSVDPVITVLSPVGSPRVLDDPERHLLLEHRVVVL